ncbi:hypothetical protein C8Q78DRAFT_1074981 [Trametes maxima]|nr:hypothetical protein C8Q78DRAFT_1074981 [Trametes maxima]
MAHDFLDKLLRQRPAGRGFSAESCRFQRARAEASEAREQALQRDLGTSRKNERNLQQRLKNEEDLQRQLGVSRGNELALQERLDTSTRENRTLTENLNSSTKENETLKTQVEASEDEKKRLQQGFIVLEGELDESRDRIGQTEELLRWYEAQHLDDTLRCQELRSDFARMNGQVLHLTNEHARLLTFANARIAAPTEDVIVVCESVWQFHQAAAHFAQFVGQNIAGFAVGIVSNLPVAWQ